MLRDLWSYLLGIYLNEKDDKKFNNNIRRK